MIAASEGANNTHLEALSKLSSLLMKDAVRNKLMGASSPEEIIAVFNEFDVEEETVETSIEKIWYLLLQPVQLVLLTHIWLPIR